MMLDLLVFTMSNIYLQTAAHLVDRTKDQRFTYRFALAFGGFRKH